MELLIPTGDIPKLNHSHNFSSCCIGPAQPVFCLMRQFAMKRLMFGSVVVDKTDTFCFFEQPHSFLTPRQCC